MTTCFLAPDPIQGTWLIPGGNTPANGGQLFFYVDGSVSTKQTAYKDSGGVTPWSNPIVLDSGGNLPNGGQVWFPQGQTFKVVFAPVNDTDPPTSPYRTLPSLAGINDTTTLEWLVGPTPTFVNASSFTMAGDQTAIFQKSRRLKFTVTAGTIYGAVGLAAFATSTTVNPVFASGSLDAGLTAVSYSLVAADPSSINADYIHKKATAVPSSGNGTTNIWGIDGDYVHVTGTNTIAHFSTAPYAGAERDIIFDGVLSINTSAALSAPGGNITTAANDRAKVRAETTSTNTITFYERASGRALVSSMPQPTRTTFTSASGTFFTSSLAQPPVYIDAQLIGGGGGGAASNTGNGTTGSSTTFSSSGLSLQAGGGTGGTQGGGGTASGGIATGGDINIAGGGGCSGINPGGGGTVGGGAGGNGFFGGGGPAPGANQTGVAGTANTGGGGSGGGATTAAAASGGGGGAGAYLWKRITSPATSYAWSVGAGGAGGAVSGQSGGTGGSGIIILDFYYY